MGASLAGPAGPRGARNRGQLKREVLPRGSQELLEVFRYWTSWGGNPPPSSRNPLDRKGRLFITLTIPPWLGGYKKAVAVAEVTPKIRTRRGKVTDMSWHWWSQSGPILM